MRNIPYIGWKWTAIVTALCLILFSSVEARSQNTDTSDNKFPDPSELIIELKPIQEKKHSFQVKITNRSDKPLIYFDLAAVQMGFWLYMKSEEKLEARQAFVAGISVASLPLSSRTESSGIIERHSKMTFELDLGSMKWRDGKSSYIGPEVIKNFSELPMAIYFGNITLKAPVYTQSKLLFSQTTSFPTSYESDQVKIDLWETDN